MAKRSRPAQIVYTVEFRIKKIFDESAELGVNDVSMFGSTFTVPTEHKFGSLDSVSIYLEQVTGLKSFYAEFGSVKTPQVKEVGKDSTGAYLSPTYDKSVIYLAPHGGGISGHLRETIVIHELAHHIEDELSLRTGINRQSGHSKNYLDTLIKLYEIVYGDPMFANMFKFMLLEEGAKL